MNLAELRKREGLSQEELGKRMGVHQTRVHYIETASPQSLRVSTILRYLVALGAQATAKTIITARFGDETMEFEL